MQDLTVNFITCLEQVNILVTQMNRLIIYAVQVKGGEMCAFCTLPGSRLFFALYIICAL